MPPDERKAWELIIRDIPEVGDDVPWFLRGPEKRAILAADAELKRLREAMEWALERLIRATVMSMSPYYIEAVIETIDELRRRAKEG